MNEDEVLAAVKEYTDEDNLYIIEIQRELIVQLSDIAKKYKEESKRAYERGFNDGQTSGARVWG